MPAVLERGTGAPPVATSNREQADAENRERRCAMLADVGAGHDAHMWARIHLWRAQMQWPEEEELACPFSAVPKEQIQADIDTLTREVEAFLEAKGFTDEIEKFRRERSI